MLNQSVITNCVGKSHRVPVQVTKLHGEPGFVVSTGTTILGYITPDGKGLFLAEGQRVEDDFGLHATHGLALSAVLAGISERKKVV